MLSDKTLRRVSACCPAVSVTLKTLGQNWCLLLLLLLMRHWFIHNQSFNQNILVVLSQGSDSRRTACWLQGSKSPDGWRCFFSTRARFMLIFASGLTNTLHLPSSYETTHRNLTLVLSWKAAGFIYWQTLTWTVHSLQVFIKVHLLYSSALSSLHAKQDFWPCNCLQTSLILKKRSEYLLTSCSI